MTFPNDAMKEEQHVVVEEEERNGLEMTRSSMQLVDDEASNLLSEEEGLHSSSLHQATAKRNFILMSLLFSTVPAAALACLSLATARLQAIGAWSSGVLYLTYTTSSIGGATYVVKRLGSRDAVVVGMALYCLYVSCFWLATVAPSKARSLALSGAAIGGVGAGIMWTSQGVYFSQAAEEYANESGTSRETSNGYFAGIFAFILLVEEMAFDVVSTLLVRGFDVHWSVVFALYSGLAVLATIGMRQVKRYECEEEASSSGDSSIAAVFYKVTAAFDVLIRDPKMKYMIGFNAAFGFAGAFLNSFVSGEVLPLALGDDNASLLGVFVAIHGGVASMASYAFGRLTSYTGKGLVIVIGSLSFICVACPFLVQPNVEQWTWRSLIFIYALEGIGRATFEGTLKAVFADFFSYEKEGAFANIILQNGLMSSIAYVLSFRLSCAKESLYCIRYRDGSLHDVFAFASMVVVAGVASIFGYWRASCLHGSSSNTALMTLRPSTRGSAPSTDVTPRATKVEMYAVSTLDFT